MNTLRELIEEISNPGKALNEAVKISDYDDALDVLEEMVTVRLSKIAKNWLTRQEIVKIGNDIRSMAANRGRTDWIYLSIPIKKLNDDPLVKEFLSGIFLDVSGTFIEDREGKFVVDSNITFMVKSKQGKTKTYGARD